MYHIPTKVEMIARLLEMYGEKEAIHFISNLPEAERSFLSISRYPEKNSIYPNIIFTEKKNNSSICQKIAVSPEGISYLVSFKDPSHLFVKQHLFDIPIPMLWFGLFGGLLFSLFLAWNLTRPMKLFKQSFNQIAQGNLSVRLFDKLRWRNDEISDLAKDFDSMVEQLDTLILNRKSLLHDISHELRTPLARLQLAIGLAQQSKNSQSSIDASLNRIELESQRLDSIIGEILNYSRIDFDSKLDEYVDLKALMNIVVYDAIFDAQPKKIEINFESNQIIHSIIKGNSVQIRRAIDNVISNAIRFSTEGKKVDIFLKENGRYLQVDVIDQGPGVEEAKLSCIFDPFVRIQSSLLGKGYGIGLAISRKIVTMHNGLIQAKNQETGGLIVTIKFPYWGD